jgi:hypothetical protein
VAFEPNGENVAEVLLGNSNASSMRIGTTTVMNAIGPRLRPYDLDADPRVALRAYIDAMYDCVAHDSCTQLGTSVETTDLEALGMIINYAYQLRPWGDKAAIANDISWVLLGTWGEQTPLFKHIPSLIQSIGLSDLASALHTPNHPFSTLGGLAQDCSQGAAFHPHYGAGQCNQIYHFWSYFTSFSHFPWATTVPQYIFFPYLGIHTGIMADIYHECIGIGGPGSTTDARLSTAAWELATDSTVSPGNLAANVINTLSAQRPPGTDGILAWWYYVAPECGTLASVDESERLSGQTTP